MSVEEAMNDFIQVIKDSDTYKEYRRQLELVLQEPELKKQIDEYRSRNYEMQMSDNVAFDRVIAFEQEFKGFRENPLVDSFLAAELDFCRMMQNVYFKMTDSFDFQ